MLLRIYTEILEIPDDNILFIVLSEPKEYQKEIDPKLYPVRVYLRNGLIKEGHMTDYSLKIHSNLLLDKPQLDALEKIFYDRVKENDKYTRRLHKLFKFLKKFIHE
jgi:hypothetical protein